MPQISSIEPQKKKENRLNIFLDGKFAFGASAEIILKNNLKVGTNLSQKLIDQITKEDQSTKLMDRVMNFLSFRPRSEKEVRDYLAKKIANFENIKFTQASQSPLIDSIIKKLKKYNYINDLEFTKWWVTSRKNRPRGQMVIKAELIKKGIEKETIDQIITKSVNETMLAKKSIEKKIKFWRKLTPLDFKKKFYSYLASRGFSYDTIAEMFAIYKKKA